MILPERGGTGPADKLTPAPHKTHNPEAIVQVVCR